MYDIRIDQQKNCLYLTFKGIVQDADTKHVMELVIAALDQLQPGFTVINDMSEFDFVTPQGIEYGKQTMLAMVRKGIKCAIRIGQSPIGAMQVNRTQQDAGNPYEVISVRSREEAERRLAEASLPAQSKCADKATAAHKQHR